MKKTIKMLKHIITLLCICTISLSAQSPILYTLEDQQLDKAEHQFEEGLYSAAQRSYIKVVQSREKIDNYTNDLLCAKAKLGEARCKLKLAFIEAPSQLRKVVKEYFPLPFSYAATMDLANYYFNTKNYNEALHFFKLLDGRSIDLGNKEELAFKLGYTHFVKKEFAKAENYFSRPLNKKNKYYNKTTYYQGMVSYFSEDYDDALKAFTKVENNKEYRSHIPYYICQIYFAQKKYEELIKYGTKTLRKSNLKKENDIHLILGQAYFIQKDYQNALPHLAFYEKNMQKLSEDEFYQLGYTQYQLRNYEGAIDNLIELSNLKNKMGVLSNYYLADSYMKIGDKVSARTAFKQVSEIDILPEIKDEALFNYAKLSAESGHDREAIHSLLKLTNHKTYKSESQNILSQLLLHTTDYTNAIKTIEKLPSKTAEMTNALVKLYLLRSIQLYNDGFKNDAFNMFTNVLNNSLDNKYNQQARYYQALIAHQNGDIDKSIQLTTDYLDNKKEQLPDESSIPMANYLQANNYLLKKNYTKALAFFESTNQTSSIIIDPKNSKKLRGEALIRSADCAFQTGDKSKAATLYDKSRDLNNHNLIYATYQLSILKGLESKPYEKIILLEKITESKEENEMMDQALMQLGNTFLSLQKYNKAFNAYKRIIKQHKNSDYINSAFLKLGLISYNQGDVQDALSFYKEIFKHTPKPQEIQQALLSIQEIYVSDLGQAEEYVQFTENVAGHKISDFAKDSLHYSIAYNQYKNAKYQLAIDKFNRYLDKYNTGFYQLLAHYYRAESFTLLKKYSQAIEDYKVVIDAQKGENYKKSLQKAALISYNHQQNFEESLKYYKLFAEQTDNNQLKYEAYMGALHSAYRVNNDDDIKLYANKVIQNPLLIEKDKTTAWFYIGKTNHKNNHFDQAITALNKVVRLSNNEQSAEAKYLLADIFYRKKMYDKAQKQCLDISDNTANYPFWVAKSLILLSDVLVQKTDFFNAKAALEAVIEHYQDNPDILKTATAKLEKVKEIENNNSRIKAKGQDGEIEMEDE